MTRFIDMSGLKCGALTVINRSGSNKRGEIIWLCKCVCGSKREFRGPLLRNGTATNCGCMGRVKGKHGHAKKDSETETYQSWLHMRQRCNNQNNDSYEQYGGRGITICSSWDSFEKFLSDMGERPNGTTLERVDNEKGYSRSNCQWSDKKSQQRNRRSNHIIKTKRGEMCISEAAELYGINQSVLGARIRRGWDVEIALTSPIQKRK